MPTLTGQSEEEIQGWGWINALHPDDRERTAEIWSRAVATKSIYETEYRLRTAQGVYRDFYVRAVPVITNEGHIREWVGTSTDITERKQAEEQLKATSEQLRALMARLRRAREEEGIRIAREIHDELGSALTSLRWDLEGIDKTLSQANVQTATLGSRQKIESMIELINSTIKVVRRISSELRPSILDDLGLAEAIEWQAQQFQERSGIICRCNFLVEQIGFNQEQSTAIFRIFQEALTNILRHAQATRVEITMEEDADNFILTIQDNGRGITESEQLGRNSLGLLGMRERAYLIGGEVHIKGAKDNGTTITICVPAPNK